MGCLEEAGSWALKGVAAYTAMGAGSSGRPDLTDLIMVFCWPVESAITAC